jgi:hypothetical protein
MNPRHGSTHWVHLADRQGSRGKETATMTDHEYRQIARITATRCCVCSLPLTDAESVEHGIGPVCSRRYYNPAHVPSADQVATSLGVLATSGLPEDLIEGCLKFSDSGDARKLSNLLIYFASAHYDERSVVLTCSAVIRALGYVELADKLEQDRTVALVLDNGDHFECYITPAHEADRNLGRIPGAEPLTVVDGTETLRAKKGKKHGWKIPAAGKPHLDCVLGVAFGGKLMTTGNSVMVKVIPRSYYDLRAFTNPAPAGVVAPTVVEAHDGVSITERGEKLEVRTPYNATFVAEIKLLPYKDRRWCFGFWEVSARHLPTVRDLISRCYGVAV